jgi:hypothetical protein
MSDKIEEYGWSAVVRDPKILLDGKPYINAPTPILVKDIPFPTDEIVKKVQEYARTELIEQTFNHSMRVYYFGKYLCSSLKVYSLCIQSTSYTNYSVSSAQVEPSYSSYNFFASRYWNN